MAKPKSKIAQTQRIFEKSWGILVKNWKVIGILVAIPLALDLILLNTVFDDVRDSLYYDTTESAGVGDLLDQLTTSFWSYVMISFIFGILLSGALITALLKICRGSSITIGEALNAGLERFWDVFSISVVLGVIILAGALLFVIPGLIIAFFMMFALHARIDKNLSIGDSMMLSYRKSSQNSQLALLVIIGFILVAVAIGTIGSVLIEVMPDSTNSIWATIINIPLSAYLSVVFTMTYMELKAASSTKKTAQSAKD